eukprot:CAMPEP_0172484976 /NCGR_PEP_ID=MMETSP1066-20121228/12691_1 /TAXON_ID=671091 /ORGANISM="Coscinodiscus wailesii, Strain CCMP2513" /LENGTH=61 /DNA_ID=CAMNT_0013249845 /DNA_START=89 /DNA_END=274 /DNA_ORIENTATION=+
MAGQQFSNAASPLTSHNSTSTDVVREMDVSSSPSSSSSFADAAAAGTERVYSRMRQPIVGS